MGYYDYDFGPYVSVAEKRERALKAMKKLKSKGNIEPIIIEGREIAKTWWGQAWNLNLERYADFEYRLERGRSYVRHNAVLDLKITTGKVNALVQGSEASPYKIEITIKPLMKTLWQKIKKECSGKIESLQYLLEGQFPKEQVDIFFTKGKGLFPTPKEINFKCSCPDIASICKHVAATLYGIGARLDHNPSLFFTLRNIDMQELISKTVREKTEKLLKKAEKKSSRVMENIDAKKIFGIEME